MDKLKSVENWKLKKSVPILLLDMWNVLKINNKKLDDNQIYNNFFEFAGAFEKAKEKLGDDMNALFGTILSLGIFCERNKLLEDIPFKSKEEIKSKSYFG